MIAAIENKESYVIDALRALHAAKAAWGEVTKETVANCFLHSGFKIKEYKIESDTPTAQNSEVQPSTSVGFDRFSD